MENKNITEYHIPIMVKEIRDLLQPQRGGIYIDGTFGGGGHSSMILGELPNDGRLYSIDRDSEAITAGSQRLLREHGEKAQKQFSAIKGNFFDMKYLLMEHKVMEGSVTGILLDLGVSSHQLDDAERGFSFRYEAKLDMRMDKTQEFSAYEAVNNESREKLAEIFRIYGEERFAGKIASAIVRRRERGNIETTTELADIVRAVVPAKNPADKNHSVMRVFQSIRIYVNKELDGLENAMEDAVDMLAPGGVLCVLTFHSLEDRIAKQLFKRLENPCTCPADFPICVCNKKPVVEILTKRPVTASEDEEKENSRAHSAKLRAVRKI